ncbi:MAG: type II toxin-antitoxin system VapC family toxin [candidate division NC10 bacterium]|nr:type II toxin-antitoxin system VapC family toxin [candidate division NC10 bacterium]
MDHATMVKVKLYLDSSVPSAYFDSRAPDRQRLTQQFWKDRLPDSDAVISAVVLKEIADTPDPTRRQKIEELVTGMTLLPLTEEATALAQEYVRQRIFPEQYESDALHVAIAVVNGVGYLASWNFKHLVNVRTRREVNLVNALRGYQPIEIVAPPEL